MACFAHAATGPPAVVDDAIRGNRPMRKALFVTQPNSTLRLEGDGLLVVTRDDYKLDVDNPERRKVLLRSTKLNEWVLQWSRAFLSAEIAPVQRD